jgi:opacity protein-like surface antigen
MTTVESRAGSAQQSGCGRSTRSTASGLIAALCVCCLSAPVAAERGGSYVGLGLGMLKYPDATSWVSNEISARMTAAAGIPISASATQDTYGMGAKLFGGYAINQNASVEVGYHDLGETKITVATAPVVTSWTYTVDGRALSLSLILAQEVGLRYAVFGKMGWYRAETKITSRKTLGTDVITERESATNMGTMFGLGMTYLLSSSMSLRAEWENLFRVGDDIKTAKGDVNMLSVSVVHRF